MSSAVAAAEHGLFAEEIALGLLAEVGIDHAGLQTAERKRVSQCAFQRLPGGILVDSDQGGYADAFGIQFADAVAGRLGRDHGDIDIGGRSDGAEVDVEAVGEHERLAGGHVGSDLVVIEIGLYVIGHQDHHHVGRLSGIGGGKDFESGGLGLGGALAAGAETDHYIDAGIAQIQSVGVALAAVADDGDCAPAR